MLTNARSANFDFFNVLKRTMVLLACCLLMSLCGLLAKVANAQSIAKQPTQAYQSKDPTRPPSRVVQQLSKQIKLSPKYELTAIFNRDAQIYAVVNGNIVKVGDNIANMKVTDISNSQLKMNDMNAVNKQVVLELHGSVSVKKQVSQ